MMSTKIILVEKLFNVSMFRSRHLDRGEDYPPLEHFLFTENGNINIGYQPLQRSIYHYHLVRYVAKEKIMKHKC